MKSLLSMACFILLQANLLFSQNRDCDPVVLLGNELSCMVGQAPTDIVGFKYENGNWIQVPVQIDERRLMNTESPFTLAGCNPNIQPGHTWQVHFYTDPNTDVGADTNANFDNDDEFVFMQKDIGTQAPINICPPGVVNTTRCEIEVRDPFFNNDLLGYLYVFEQDGSLQQDAGVDYVDYDYDDFNGSYIDNYLVCFGGEMNVNLEDSEVTTNNYSMHFKRRWENDSLKITAGNATGINILDRHQYFSSINSCKRSEVKFSQRSGAIIANIDGPVRAIRSVMGAHSGTYMELDLIFTECRADNYFYYRIHPSIGYYESRDLNVNATGMSFFSDRNPGGSTIDGNDDEDDFVIDEPAQWELTTGAPGSIATTYTYDTDIVLGTRQQYQNELVDGYVQGYYRDEGADEQRKCTGDMESYGSSGFHLYTKVCTDGLRPWDGDPSCAPNQVKYFESVRYNYFLPPMTTTSEAMRYADFAKNPLTATSMAQNCTTQAPTCMDGIENGDETGVDCGGTNCQPCAAPCPNLDLTTLPSSSGTHIYENHDTITCSAAQQANTDVELAAANTVILQDGFHAIGGSTTFEARIQVCNSSSRSESINARSKVIKTQIQVFPNPAHNYLTVQSTRSALIAVQLYDLNGKQVAQQSVNNSNIAELQISHLPSGIYFAQIKTEATTKMVKVMIQ
ncbi:MAG: T9SS type A sorting domain-containing protein [Bacteroidota bacterium]